MKIFMTGATGTVGSALLPFLLERGHRVSCLVRKGNGVSARTRLEQVIGQIGGACEVLSGDITLENCGLNGRLIESRRGYFDVVIHCAASVKMQTSYEEKAMMTNVIGTKNVLDLAKVLQIEKFHHISTAYVTNGESNIYERTKLVGEKLVEQSQIPYTISRISIVIGSSQTGAITHFSGYYGFFLPFWAIKHKIASVGTMDLGGISIDVDMAASLNLIPLDWTVKMLGLITERDVANGILHVVHPKPTLVMEVIAQSLKILDITGYAFNDRKARLPAQRIIDGVIKVFHPYTNKQLQLSNEDLCNFLGRDYVAPPMITEELLRRMLMYAIKEEFGGHLMMATAA